jgi:hypothetical protein
MVRNFLQTVCTRCMSDRSASLKHAFAGCQQGVTKRHGALTCNFPLPIAKLLWMSGLFSMPQPYILFHRTEDCLIDPRVQPVARRPTLS